MKKLVLVLTVCFCFVAPLSGATFYLPWNHYVYDIIQRMRAINTEKAQLKELEKIAEMLGANSMGADVGSVFNGTEANSFEERTHALSFDSNQIAQEYETLFPVAEEWEAMSYEGKTKYYKDWNDELYIARQNALSAQSNVQDYRSQVQTLMQGAGDNMIPILQRMLQTLGVISYQLSDLSDVIVSANRVAVTESAVLQQHQIANEGLPYTDIEIDVEAFEEENTPENPISDKPFSLTVPTPRGPLGGLIPRE